MLEILLNQLNNYFEREILHDIFVIENGTLQGVSLLDGQYFFIKGSILNDGLHAKNAGLTNETFDGCVSLLAIPKAVIELATEIEEFLTADEGMQKNNPNTSESFAGYSYSKATTPTGKPIGWQEVFAQQMRPYRKIVR